MREVLSQHYKWENLPWILQNGRRSPKEDHRSHYDESTKMKGQYEWRPINE